MQVQDKPLPNISVVHVNNFASKAAKVKATETLGRLEYQVSQEEGFWTLQKGDPRIFAQVLRKNLGKDAVTFIR